MPVNTFGSHVPPWTKPSGLDGLASAKGSHVPPHSQLQVSWAWFLAQAQPGTSLQTALDLFDRAVAAGDPPSPQPPSAPVPSIPPSANCAEWSPGNAYSRIYLAATRLSGLFDATFDTSDRQVTVTLGGQPLHSWGTQTCPDVGSSAYGVALLGLQAVVEPTADDELKEQSGAPELFMLWAVRDQMKDPAGMPWTMLVLDVLMLGLAFPLYEVKALVDLERPSRNTLGIAIAPNLVVPEHASWPAGHAYVGGLLATVLSGLAPAGAARLRAAGLRLGFNRERAGLHTRLDTSAGFAMGAALAHDLLDRIQQATAGTREARLWNALQCARREWQ